MMFPAFRALPALGLPLVIAAAGVVLPSATANAEPPPGAPLPHVKYTVWAEQPFFAEIPRG